MGGRAIAGYAAICAAALLLLGPGCQPDDRECEQALRQLDVCLAQQCNGPGALQDPVCRQFASRSLLRGPVAGDRCAALSPELVSQLAEGSCVAPAALASGGKSDGVGLPIAESGYTMTMLSQEPGRMTLELDIHDLAYTTRWIDGVAYHEIDRADAGRLTAIGRPLVPIFHPMLAISPRASHAWIEAVHIDEADRLTFGGINLIPFQKPVVEDDPAHELVVDASFYGRDEWYPDLEIDEQPLELGTWRNYRVVRSTMAPIRYNAARQELTVMRKIIVTVGYFEDPNLADATVASGSATFASSYRRELVNYYEAADDQATGSDGDIQYLVLVQDDLLDAVLPLVQHKNDAGVTTEVVTTSSITAEGEYRPGPEAIKQTIRTYFEQHGIEYVLLVGDVTGLPMYSWEGLPSDAWYGCLRGEDPLPEVLVGRITGQTPEQISAHVGKIIAHDQQVEAQEAWKKRILLVNHQEEAPKKYTANSEAIRQRGYYAHSFEFLRAYGSEQSTNADISGAIEDGVAVVNYRGHGSKSAWSGWNGDDFGVAEVEALTNDKLPVVLSVACWNLGLQSLQRTLAEAWVQHPSGGAVAFLGATRPSYTVPNHDFNRHLFWGLLSGRAPNIGTLLAQASARLYKQYGDDPWATANLRMYGWIGDPATRLGDDFYQLPPLSPNGVIINEVLADPPDGHAGDANGDGVRSFASDEFVEIVNTNAHPVDLSGYTLADDLFVRFTFPQGTTVAPGRAVVVFGGGAPETFAPLGQALVLASERPLQLNNDGDTLTLAAPDGRGIDRLRYSRADARDRAMVRATDGDPAAPFVPHPGEPPFSPGTRTDGSWF